MSWAMAFPEVRLTAIDAVARAVHMGNLFRSSVPSLG
jgi:hypothetical protein